MYKVLFYEYVILINTDTFDTLREAEAAERYWKNGKPTTRSFTIQVCKR
jgi:hypothetical protein